MNQRKSRSRSGAVLICVLACLGVVIALVLTSIQSSLRGRKEVRMQRHLLQTELLCEAGVQRAVQQLKTTPEYKGEQWFPKLGTASFENAVIEIRIEPSTEEANSLRAVVIATLSDSADRNDRMQRSHTLLIDISSTSTETQK